VIGKGFCSGIVATLLVAGVAHGQAYSQVRTEADLAFERGHVLKAQGAWVAACREFAKSYALLERHGTLLNLAVCAEQLGERRTAYVRFEQALVDATNDGRPDRVELAKEHLARLRSELAFLSIDWQRVASVSGLELWIDGVKLEGAPSQAVPLEPGSHHFEARAPGAAPFPVELELDVGTAKQIVVPPLEASKGSDADASKPTETVLASVAPTPSAPPPSPRTSRASRFPLALALIGVGVVVAGVGTYYGVKAIQEGDSLQQLCPGLACTSEAALDDGRRLEADAERHARISDVALPLGALTAAAGVIVLWTAPSPEESVKASSTSLKVRVAPQSASIHAELGGAW
jgi:hypothetical protein